MKMFIKLLTVSLGALVLALALDSSAQAFEEVQQEIFTRTKTFEQANDLIGRINQGQVPGWKGPCSAEYDDASDSYIVYACRSNPSPAPPAPLGSPTGALKAPAE